jgi:predicted amidophosphoribosyltransferase
MFEKKKNFTFCMYEKFHKKLTKFAKKAGHRSLSEFFAKVGQQEIDRARKKKGDISDG